MQPCPGGPNPALEHPTLPGQTAGDTGPMEELDEDEEDNEEFLERLMAQTGRDIPQRELEEHYAVLEELGSGTYGCVVLTEPRDGGSPVVLKLMAKEQTERRAFLREYCIALCLSGHAGCLRALPLAFESSTHFAFGQELAPAGDLCALLKPGEGLAEELVKRCASQLAEALDFMHNRALVHRDVKLDNVLLFDRECRRVKLGDFGLTRIQGSVVGAMSGTLPYAPPELCLLQGSDTLELDSSLDVWAFGVLIFCLCTGCFPWAVATSSDPQFEDFSAWQGGAAEQGVPASWQGFGSRALEMLRRLLTLDPVRRSPAIEVQKYLALPWVMAPSTKELAPSSSQSPLNSSMGPSPGCIRGQDAAGGGDGVPVIPCEHPSPVLVASTSPSSWDWNHDGCSPGVWAPCPMPEACGVRDGKEKCGKEKQYLGQHLETPSPHLGTQHLANECHSMVVTNRPPEQRLDSSEMQKGKPGQKQPVGLQRETGGERLIRN